MKLTLALYKTAEDQPDVEVTLEDVNPKNATKNAIRTFVAHNVNLGHNLVRDVFVDVTEE